MPDSLVEKIAKVCLSVKSSDVLKQGENADAPGGGYWYLRILDLSEQLREKLFAAGVLIIPSDGECVIGGYASSDPNRPYTTACVKTQFRLTDGVQSMDFSAYGYAADLDGKCVAIAQTAALKSFLKRLALIFGEWDDPEVPRAPWKTKEQKKEQWEGVAEHNASVMAETAARIEEIGLPKKRKGSDELPTS